MAKITSLCFYLVLAAIAAVFSQTAAKRNKKWILLIPILILSFVAGLRAATVGTDTKNVLAAILFNRQYGFLVHSKEWLFHFLCEYLMKLWDNTSFVLFVLALINYSLVFFRLWDFRKSIHIGVAASLFVLFYFGTSLNIIRQSLAVAIIFYSSRYLQERKNIKFLLGVVIASLFHISAFFAAAIPIFFIFADKRLTLKNLGAVFAYCFGFGMVGVFLVRFYGGYLHGDEVDIGLMVMVCIGLLVMTYFPFFMEKYLWKTETDSTYILGQSPHLLFALSIVGYLVQCMGFVFTWAGRAGMYMKFFEIVFFGSVFQSRMYDRLFKIALFVILLLLGGYSLWTYSHVVPYMTVFSA
ncbi:MAG: EpsG family protein [Clostridia bacterium]|nr:EpsG family protein [Clostridia bacterium]